MNALPMFAPRSLTVLIAPHGGGEPVTRLIAELALRGPVTVLDGGNRFPAYRLIRALGRRAFHPAEVTAAASRVGLQRAFTCYQVLALLEGTLSLSDPCLLLDPFSTFYDEQVPIAEVTRLLEACLRQLDRLRIAAPLFAALPPARTPERAFLVEGLCLRADTCYTLDLPAPQVSQPSLF
jgi:hypothetical protein